MKEVNVGKLAFSLVYSGEAGEGYEIGKRVVGESKNYYQNISSKVVLDFLDLDETKVKVVVKKKGPSYLLAYNSISNETIRIDGLGDHFLALLKAVQRAEWVKEDLKYGNKVKLIDHAFIQSLNAQLLSLRYEFDEVAIGQYRYLDFAERVHDVHHTMVDDEGKSKRSISANIETAADLNVVTQMKKLVDWVNNGAFKSGDDMLDMAKFHARFVQIQPFADGNKRTARLLTNYLLLVKDLPLIDINEDNRDEYLMSIYYSTAENEEIFRNESAAFRKFGDKIFAIQGERTEENKYMPLKWFFEKYRIKENSKKVIEDILRYDAGRHVCANQIDSSEFDK